MKFISKIGLLMIGICVLIGITISRMLNAHSDPETTRKAIVKNTVETVIKDTIIVKGEFTDANVSVICYDNAEYLFVKYGGRFQIIKHK